MVSFQDFSVTLLYGTKVFVLYIHLMTDVGISSSHCQAVQDALHVGIIGIEAVVYVQQAAVVLVTLRLVKKAQHHIKTVVDTPTKARYLDDNTVVSKTVNKGVWQAFCYWVVIIVKRLVVHIEHRLLYVTHLMPQQVDGHHRQGVPLVLHVLGIGIMHA